MNTNTTRRIARFFALPAVAAGIAAGALGFAGAASAGTYTQDMTPRPGIVAGPVVKAHPAPEMPAGTHHHGLAYAQDLAAGRR
ncbi:hypothetical protein H7J88_03910 [Mycolicibacterium flavescens]|uniref:Uncharacterized protein n=1 Tax=Mycolicibacterium flavescens TaxID=1776 RepID=A0A1E3RGE5_MYCFV|nr:hypothetical protein [Mycolicibacterium flavescens]MCV7278790.1 hypothetical protein [Mycolicibacterium flavescens]ODQ88532.1 hypothetical protein BHQ18_18845 [Mycolicibacterium flavescens]